MSAKKVRFDPHTCPALLRLTNWDICILCQDHGGTLITYTSNSLSSIHITSQNISALPEQQFAINIDISRLNNGNGLVDITRLPKWHKACYVLCNAGKTARAKNFLILQCKQHLSSTSAPSRSMKTDSDDELAWFFCDDTTGNLTKVETTE